jgi:hypothetical protein
LSEWALALLALVLAVLIWYVLRLGIERNYQVDVQVRPVVGSPALFAAFYQGKLTLHLQGPQGELDKAIRLLDQGGRTIEVLVSDLRPGENQRYELVNAIRLLRLPFNRRLVRGFDAFSVEIVRIAPKDLVVEDPVLEGVPEGYAHEIRLEPPVLHVVGPVRGLGEGTRDVIRPDPIKVGPYFANVTEGVAPLLPPALPLHFDGWRTDPDYHLYRARVQIPPVQATLRFFPREGRAISNRIWRLYDAQRYEVEIPAPPGGLDVVRQEYTGRFEGRADVLRLLAEKKDAWFFAVVVRPEDLPPVGSEETVTRELPIQAFGLGQFPGIRFAPEGGAASVSADIRRKTP